MFRNRIDLENSSSLNRPFSAIIEGQKNDQIHLLTHNEMISKLDRLNDALRCNVTIVFKVELFTF